MADLDTLALHAVTCTYCGARPGHPCVTVRGYSRTPGRRSRYLHADRTALIREAWRVGHREGMATALESVRWGLEAARRGDYWANRDGVPAIPEPAGTAVDAYLADRVERVKAGGWV